MSLDTGERIHRYSWDVLPISKGVIDRVNMLGHYQNQPIISTNFKYQWDPNGEDVSDDIAFTTREDGVDDVAEMPPPLDMLMAVDEGVMDVDVEEDQLEHEELGVFIDDGDNVVDLVTTQVIDEIDEINNVALEEEAMEDACHDMDNDIVEEEVEEMMQVKKSLLRNN